MFYKDLLYMACVVCYMYFVQPFFFSVINTLIKLYIDRQMYGSIVYNST